VSRSRRSVGPQRSSVGRLRRHLSTRARPHRRHAAAGLLPLVCCYAKDLPSSFYRSGDFLTPPPTCRTSSGLPPTTPPSSLAGMSRRAGEFHPPRCHASPVRDGPRDHARWVRCFVMNLSVKTDSNLSHPDSSLAVPRRGRARALAR
jgi:hypothetical protein